MFYNLKSLLPKSIKRAGIANELKNKQIIDFFNLAKKVFLRAELADRVKPMYLRNKILYIASLSSVAAERLGPRQAEIVAEINKKFGPGTVKKIKFIT
ncbi:MAG: DciA family protein [Patescibacteria group bacterium]|nr:DciA family protein [Patescibacteria group bacterium]MDD5295107.1 DciA family protein [Patescibacteria group bacterium]MDD5554688.1 DciA family protein [Patescibacteria group bacterium]